MTVRLGDVLRLRKEVVHPHDKPTGKAIFVGLEHLEGGTGRRMGSLQLDLSHLTGRKPRFYKGDIVYGYLRPYLNKVWVAEFDGLCSVDQYVYEVDRSLAEPDFVAWFMRSPTYLAKAPVAAGPGQLPRIRLEEVAAVEIDLPGLDKQRSILRSLREQIATVERARAAAQGQFRAASMLPAACLRHVFGGPARLSWRRRTLGELCEIQLGKMLSPASKRGTAPRPYLRNANVQWNRFDLSEVLAMDFSEDEAERFALRPGDVLVCEGGEPGRAAVWNGDISPCYYQKALHRLRVRDQDAIPEFIVYRLWFGSLTGEFVESQPKTTIAHLPAVRLEKLPLAIPPTPEQRHLVAQLSGQLVEAERLQRMATDAIADLDRLRSVLLRRAFSADL